MTAPRRFSLAAVSAALTALALAGCGPQPGGNQAGAGPAGGTSTTPATSAPTTTSPPATTPTGKPGGGNQGTAVTVEGVIEPGVEHGCYVLTPTSGGRKYLVLGQTKPPTDVRVRVHGVTQPDTMSYCQQGTPLQVSTIERL